MSVKTAEEVYNFWFDKENEQYWFNSNGDFDEKIHDRFYDTWDAARQGLLFDWRETLKGSLAEIIVLDQFSRNLNRGKAFSYMQDTMALILSQNLMNSFPEYRDLPDKVKSFILLPWMHSESRAIQKMTEQLYLEMGNPEHTKIMYQHKEIIDQFGRYPYRNEILGRKSTPEEIKFIKGNDLEFTKV
jgi:uncharacterized protein (DUF924 family)